MYSRTEFLYFKMAVLYTMRRKGRAILISLMIALSLTGLLLMEGMYEGMMVQITQNSIKTGSGAISIQHRGFRSDNNIVYHLADPAAIETLLERQPGVRSYAERITQRGLAATAGYSQGVNVIGIDPEREIGHSQLENFMIEGQYGFERNGAVIGYRLARKLKTSVGKKIVVTIQDVNNDVVSAALRVNGIIKTNNASIDTNGVLIRIGALRNLSGIDGATEIAVMVDEKTDEAAVRDRLAQQIADSSVALYTYKELYPSLSEGEALMQTYNKISSAFIFIVATLGIFGVVLVSVLERVREFGIMLAIGTRFADVARLIVYESLIITLSGYAAGALIGGAALWYLKVYGIDLSGLSDAFAIFGMDSTIHAVIKPDYFTGSLYSVIAATLFATIIPIRTLKRRKPIQSINEQAT